VHQAPPTEALVSLGRSRILGRIWVPPEQKEKDVYELTEILDAYHLFRALSGTIQAYGITRAQLETETFERGTPTRTDFEQLVKFAGIPHFTHAYRTDECRGLLDHLSIHFWGGVRITRSGKKRSLA
jgi:hypothetical protein